MTINSTVMTGIFNSLVVIVRAHQTMNVDSGYPFESKHNGMSAEKTLQSPLIWPLCGALQGIKQRDIDFIGFALPLIPSAPGNASTKRLHSIDKNVDLSFFEQALGGSQTNTVVGGNKVKVSRAIARWRHTHHPLLEIVAVTSDQTVDQ